MEIILVRHGEADYSEVDDKGYLGFGRDLAPLTTKGVEQANAVSQDNLLANADVIISSPYTRALHTAAIISKNLNLSLMVDLGFHERLPDTKNELQTREDFQNSFKEYDFFKGICADDKSYFGRVLNNKYTGLNIA